MVLVPTPPQYKARLEGAEHGFVNGFKEVLSKDVYSHGQTALGPPKLCSEIRNNMTSSFLVSLIPGLFFPCSFWSLPISSFLDSPRWHCLNFSLSPPIISWSPGLLVHLVSVLLLYLPFSLPFPTACNLPLIFPFQSSFLH